MPARFRTKDRVLETSVTTGAGTYTLAGAATGFQTFAGGAVAAGDFLPYFAEDGVNWEAGIGEVLSGPARLVRTAVKASSNGGAAVNWGAGTRNLRCGWPAELNTPRVQSVSIAGGAGAQALTQDQQRCDILILTGALTGNREVEVDTAPWRWSVLNNTSGAFSVTVKVNGGTGVAVAQGKSKLLYCDGTDVEDGTTDVPVELATKHAGAIRNAKWVVEHNTPGANQLRISLKTEAGADPSAADPVKVSFREAAATDGGFEEISITAALSLTISALSTLGFANAQVGRVYFGLINNAGAAEIVAAGLDAGAFTDDIVVSTTAEGGAGAADARGTLYSASARSNVGCRLGGYATIETGATAGNWSNAPSRVAQSPAQISGDPRVAQFWSNVTDGGTAAINGGSFNLSSITDNGTGDVTQSFKVSFASATYCPVSSTSSDRAVPSTWTLATGSMRIAWSRVNDSAAQNFTNQGLVIFGEK